MKLRNSPPRGTVAFAAAFGLSLSACGGGVPPSLLERIAQNLRGTHRETRTVAAGTVLTVRFPRTLSSWASRPGQPVRGEVQRPIEAGGRVVVPAGAALVGTVTAAHPPKIGGRSELAVRFTRLEMPSSRDLPVRAGLTLVGKSEKGKDIATLAGSVLGGAILGHRIDRGDTGELLGTVARIRLQDPVQVVVEVPG